MKAIFINYYLAKVVFFVFVYGFSLPFLSGDLTQFLLSNLSFVLFGYFFFKDRLNLFDPFTLFSIYYLLIVPSAWHLYVTGFSGNLYIEGVLWGSDKISLLNVCLIYCIFGYLFALLGYKLFKMQIEPVINLDVKLPLKLIKLCVFLFAFIAVGNFIINLLLFAGGNPVVYFSNISLRKFEFAEQGTTLGYLFGYVAAFLWAFIQLKKRKLSFAFLAFLGFTVIIKASTGRILGTIFYMMNFVAIYYLANFRVEQKRNKKYILFFVILFCFALGFYFFRVTSSLAFNNQLNAGWLNTMVGFVDFQKMMLLIVDRGNTPNVAVFMKVVDSWEKDIGFLYGESIVTWIFNSFPSVLKPTGYQPSVIIKKTWYSHLHGGAIPPTGIGEMYANFGPFGPFIGMFLFGVGVAFLHRALCRYNNYWFLVVYVQIIIGFVFVYPKGEFDNLSLWFVFPIFGAYCFMKIIVFFSSSKMKKITKQLECNIC